jgi:hypothetical protein
MNESITSTLLHRAIYTLISQPPHTHLIGPIEQRLNPIREHPIRKHTTERTREREREREGETEREHVPYISVRLPLYSSDIST